MSCQAIKKRFSQTFHWALVTNHILIYLNFPIAIYFSIKNIYFPWEKYLVSFQLNNAMEISFNSYLLPFQNIFFPLKNIFFTSY